MKNGNVLGKPSVVFALICLFMSIFISFDFYQVLIYGRTIMLRGADFIYFDSEIWSISNLLFFMSVGLKLVVLPIAFYYLFYCIKSWSTK